MKDASRPKLPFRPAPYRKRKASAHVTPTRGTRRAQHTSHHRNQRSVSPRPPDRTHNARRDETRPSHADSTDGEPRAGGAHVSPHTRKHTGTDTDGSARERPEAAHTNSFSAQANIPGPPLRLPLSSAPPTLTTFPASDQKKGESPPPGSVTAFLRSIQLPDKPASAPPLQTAFSLTPPSRRPPQSADSTNNGAYTNENGHQVSLTYKGHSFTYELSTLPDDPEGTIALLTLTKSDPGPYILVAAHYRRTGRSRAACAVIRSLLDNLHDPTDVEKGKEDAVPIPTSDTPTMGLPCPDIPCPKPSDSTVPILKNAAMRPAMLLLAACELDISREHPDDPESASHASTAHDLFRAVYGTVNDAIIAGVVHPSPPPKNALGLDFSSNGNCLSSSSDSNGPLANITLPPDPESLTRIQNLEKELDAARVAHKKLQERLYLSNNRLSRAEDKVHGLESHSREVRMRLDASRDENWELRQRLADSERRARQLAHCTPPPESRVWGRLKGLLFDNLGGGVRGE